MRARVGVKERVRLTVRVSVRVRVMREGHEGQGGGMEGDEV